MKKTLRIISALCCLALALTLLTATSVSAQNGKKGKTAKSRKASQDKKQDKKKVIEVKATKVTTRGSEPDPNIKETEQANDPEAQKDAPPAKGGARTRGGLAPCEVRFDNRTPWYIKVYVDGIFRGTMDQYGDGVVYVGAGATTVYARADFTDGTYKYWGPTPYDCGPGQYIYYKMYP